MTTTFKTGDLVRRKATAPISGYQSRHNSFVVKAVGPSSDALLPGVWVTDSRGQIHAAENLELVFVKPAAQAFKVGDLVRRKNAIVVGYKVGTQPFTVAAVTPHWVQDSNAQCHDPSSLERIRTATQPPRNTFKVNDLVRRKAGATVDGYEVGNRPFFVKYNAGYYVRDTNNQIHDIKNLELAYAAPKFTGEPADWAIAPPKPVDIQHELAKTAYNPAPKSIHQIRAEAGLPPISDPVNNPDHYSRGGIQVISIVEAFGLNFNLGNVVKYVLRSGFKARKLEDLKKSRWYLDREITALEAKVTK